MFLLGLPGFGLVRRTLTTALVVGGFLAGMQWQGAVLSDRCERAGGTIGTDDLCRGLR